MQKCEECGEEFRTQREWVAHCDGHHVKMVTADPLVLVIDLPDGCTPGRWEAAEAFAENVAELRRRFPGKRFQFVPVSGGAAVDAWLAIAEDEPKARNPIIGA